MIRGVIIALALVVSGASALADTSQPQPRTAVDSAAGGSHWRFVPSKRKGPVHVWVPQNYDPTTAGVVIYLHGFYTDVDKSWAKRGLAEQFAASKRNALFIACEAPSWGLGHVNWKSPNELIVSALEATKLQRPLGDVVVLGHSGAHRTFRRWLSYRRINHIILLDAMYGHTKKYMWWLAQKKSHAENRLTIVAIDTLPWSEPLWHARKDMVAIDQVPASVEEIPRAKRRARVLYMRSQHSHMALVLGRKVIPVLLQLTRLAGL